MFNVILIALFLTFMLGLVLENLKLNLNLRKVYYINDKIRGLILGRLKDEKYFNIFMINDLRQRFNEEFLKTKIIDNYELYKIDDSRIRVKYIMGYVIEELEVLAVSDGIEIKEINKVIIE